MVDIKNVRLKGNDGEDTKSRVKDAEERKASANESIEDAWQRILSMNNADKEKEKLQEVKQAMDRGDIGREEPKPGKKQGKFSKAEALRLWRVIEARKKGERIKRLVDGTPKNYVLVNNLSMLNELKTKVKDAKLIGIDCETFGEEPGDQFDPWIGEMAGFSVSVPDRHYYVPLNHTNGDQLPTDTVWGEIKDVMESTPNVMHNASFDCKFFAIKYGVDLVKNLYMDTQILAWAADENGSHRLKDLAERFLGLTESWTYDRLFSNLHRFNEVPLDASLVYGAGDTDKTLKVFDFMVEQFKKNAPELLDLVVNTEMPVLRTFIYADLEGMNFDVDQARKLDANFEKEESEIERKIHEIVGGEVNIASPAQLKEILFTDLKLPNLGQGSTATKILEKIKSKHEIVPLILDYRQVNQLRKAFTKKLPGEVKSDGKIHPDHSTWGTVTSRFTCKNPNTQQLPSKRPEIRYTFYPDSDKIFFGIDYSQIELRVLAHLANEEVLIDAFRKGKDIHSTTAAQISGIPYEQIEERKDVEGSTEQKARKNAKPVNFGIAYGLTKFGLADQLNIKEKEAQAIIDAFFRNYPGIDKYMKQQVKTARKRGYVTDMFGRKRRLKQQYKRGFKSGADRQAGNMPIQASAGGILKKAIVDLEAILRKHNVRIALQIHDELLFEGPKGISVEALDEIRTTMEKAVELVVPVNCDLEISPDYWMQNYSLDEWLDIRDNN